MDDKRQDTDDGEALAFGLKHWRWHRLGHGRLLKNERSFCGAGKPGPVSAQSTEVLVGVVCENFLKPPEFFASAVGMLHHQNSLGDGDFNAKVARL